MNNQFTRSEALLGEENFKVLQDKTILVIGIGGVGGTAFASLLRTGVKNFLIADFDKVDISNLNRQILFNLDSVGLLKVEEGKKYALKINEEANIKTFDIKINEETISCFDDYHIDFIIDAIDDVNGKIAISKYAIKRNIPFVVSLGMANRISPENVVITKLNKTTDDPLARKLRYEFKQNGIDLNEINVAFCKNPPLRKGVTPYSCMMTPSSAGLVISSYVITNLLKL